jgi:hypothetical protein
VAFADSNGLTPTQSSGSAGTTIFSSESLLVIGVLSTIVAILVIFVITKLAKANKRQV